jgi:pseudouridylate synthase
VNEHTRANNLFQELGSKEMFLLSAAVSAALNDHRPVVALESAFIGHGLPSPDNLDTARSCEQAIREAGALPATIGIVGGRVVVGLNDEQLTEIAAGSAVFKVNPANLGQIIARRRWGATTVAASLHFAYMAGIKVFATGGIGGVHRGSSESYDISADLGALAKYPVITVCSGAKAILDLPKTLEILETLGVPVVGFQADEFPAFYSRSSGLKLDLVAESVAEVAVFANAHWQLGFSSAVLVAAPVPLEYHVPGEVIEDSIVMALSEAAEQGIKGKPLTPFLLSRIAERTGGLALRANKALLRNNAEIAAKIAVAFSGRESV